MCCLLPEKMKYTFGRAQQGFKPYLWIVLYLLELVNGHITSFARKIHVVKYPFQTVTPLAGFDIQRHRGKAGKLVKSNYRTPGTEELLYLSEC